MKDDKYFTGRIEEFWHLDIPLSPREAVSDFSSPSLVERWTPNNDHVLVSWNQRKVWINGKLVYHDPHGLVEVMDDNGN